MPAIRIPATTNYAIFCIAIFALSGCSATNVNSSIIPHPTTVRDILHNTTVAWQKDLLLENPLAEDVLLRIAGGRSVMWIDRAEYRQRAAIQGFAPIIPPMTIGRNTFPGIDYMVSRYGPAGRHELEISLHFLDPQPNLSFRSVTQIMGENWRPYVSGIIEMDRPKYDPATDEHGNQTIAYYRDDASVIRSALMEFRSDGTLYNGIFKESEK